MDKENAKFLLEDFLQEKCDVASLAKIKTQIKNSPASEDATKVLNYIDENLKHTANVRRKNISIAEFIKNNSNIDFEFLNKVADTILSEKTRKVADNLINFKEADININEIDLLSEQAKKMLVNHLETQKERIIQKNTLQPFYKIKDGESQISEKIRRDIENAARMSDDLEHTRAKLENKLLKLFTFKSLPRQEISNIINEWIDIRVLDLKSKPEYKPLYDSEFRITLLDRFKNQVISDLGLYSDDNTRDFETFFPVDPLDEGSYTNDLANKDNLNHIMENALGYDRLLERLQSPENSASLAQANYFEQLLAEYYIDKRKEYKVSKDLLEVLNKEFNSTTYFNQTARIGEDLDLARGKHAGAPYIKDGLNQYDLLAEARRENVLMEPEDIHHLIDLGNSTNYAIDDETQGVAESLLKYTREKKDWPERLPKFDIKRTPKEWVEEKLTEVLNQLFSAREKIEKNVTVQTDSFENEPLIRTMERAMSRNELKSFDKELAQHLNKETMIMRLLYELDKEYAELMQKRSEGKLKKQSELDKKVQSKKHP